MKKLEIGHMKIKYPIIQGGMGVGVSLSKLAGAVSKAGGLGVISTAQIGFRKPLFQTDSFKANMEAIEEEIKKAKEICNGGYIGVNIMAVTHRYDEYVKKAIESGVDLIISGAGIAKSLPSLVKGTNTSFAPIFSSFKATKIILKMWDKKEGVVPDAIIIEGPEAGGHLAFKKEELENVDKLNFNEEVRKIIEHVKEYEKKYKKKIPIIFAGGIRNNEDVENKLKMGLLGVQVATKFVATKECDASDEFKEMYVNSKEEDIQITVSPVGMPGRALKNDFLKHRERKEINKCYKCLSKCDIKTIPYCITEALVTSVKGKVQDGLMFCGAKVHEITEITSVEEVMKELTSKKYKLNTNSY